MKHHNYSWLILLLALFFLTGCSNEMESLAGCSTTTVSAETSSKVADTVLTNGIIYTADDANSCAETIAIAGGEIIYVGSMEGIKAYVSETTDVIDLDGKFAMPSFVDSHLHPLSNAYAYNFQAALHNLNTHDEYIEAIREFVENNPDKNGFMGAGFDRYVYDEIGPRKEWLDAIDSERPIVIIDKDIHTAWVNSKVFELLGWNKNTPDPQGGVIVRDPSTREPTGLLLEMPAIEPAWLLFPYPTKAEYKESLLWISAWLNRAGITTAHDAWLEMDPNFYEAYNELAKEGKLTVRYRGSWYIDEAGDYMGEIEYALKLSNQFTHPHFQVHSFKFMADGAGETALLLKGNPDGIKVWKDETLVEALAAVDKAGYQIHVHTIGDGAVKYSVEALENVQKINGERDSRHSIVHVERARPEDVIKAGELGLYAHMTPRLIFRDSSFKMLFDASVQVTIGSDWTTSQFDVLTDIYRGMETGVSLVEMLRAASKTGAYANFLEAEIGSLEVGKKADIVVLSQNPFEILAKEIQNVEVRKTFFEGILVYEGLP